MDLASFFVKLGVKGNDDTKKKLESVRGGIGGVKKTSLETKAAILGMFYGIQRMTSSAIGMGTSLNQFALLHDDKVVESLQRYQGVAENFNVTNDEIKQSFEALTKSMYQVGTGQGAPKGLQILIDSLGDVDTSRLQDIPYMMQQIQRYVSSGPWDQMKRDMAESFGISGGMLGLMREARFTPGALASQRVLGRGQMAGLARAGGDFKKIAKEWKLFWADMTSSKGGRQMIGDIRELNKELIKMTKAFSDMINNTGALSLLGDVFKGWKMIFEAISKSVESTSKNLNKDSKKKKDEGGMIYRFSGAKAFEYYSGQFFEKSTQAKMKEAEITQAAKSRQLMREQRQESQNNITINNNNYGVKDAENLVEIMDQQIEAAGRLNPALRSE